MTVASLITKLLSVPSTSNELEFTGPGFDKAKTDLELRLPTVDEPTIIAMAAFLRYVNLDMFTDDDLRLIASINFSSIENNQRVEPRSFTFDSRNTYYDVEGLISTEADSTRFKFNRLTETDSISTDLNKLIAINKNTNLRYLAVLLSNLF